MGRQTLSLNFLTLQISNGLNTKDMNAKTDNSKLNATCFSMKTILQFGRHKGKSIQQLFDEEEDSYVMWMFENIDGEWSSQIEREFELLQSECESLKREFIWSQD